MTSFTNIYKNELKSKGVLSSLGSTALKRTRERLDPRNMLFGGSGMIAATGRKIFGKGYSAIQNDSGSKLATKTAEISGLQSEVVAGLLASSLKQESQLSIIAKNTMNNNAMARDMNVMRQNVMKLVTMGGGKASRGADMFFKDAKARENEYESKFKKGLPTTTPTPVKEESKKSKSILGMILLALGTLGTIISVALKQMRDSLGGIISGLGKTIIDGIVAALTGLGILKGLPLPTPGPGKTGPGTPGTPGKTGPSPGAPKPSAAVVAGGVLTRVAVPVAAIAAVVTGVKIHDDDKAEYLDLAKKKRDEGLTSEEEARIRKLSTISFRAAATQILNYDPIEGKASEAKTSGEIAAMQKREALKIGGPKMPTPEQYATGLDEEIRMARENLKKEEQAAKLTPNRPLVEQGLTQLREKLQKLEQERNSKVNDYTQATSSKSDASYAQAEANRLSAYKSPDLMAQNMSAYVSRGGTGRDDTSPSKATLLDMIAGAESGKMGYDAANKGKAGDTPGGMPGLSNMTVGEVMQLQKEKKLFAAGRYQIIPETLTGLLRGAYGDTGVTVNDIFDSSTQDKLGSALIDNRLKKGKGDPFNTQLELSKEFASIADPRTEKSYYAGRGNNKASISSEQIQVALSGQTPTLQSAPSSGTALASASTASSDLNRASSTQPPPVVNVNATNNNNVAGGKGGEQQVASATNIDALDLFFKFTM